MSRLKEIKEIYDYSLKEIMKDDKSWKVFLTFHAKIYKHSFNNAVLIYAQRPEATLVADMEIWNRRLSRWINRGSKSIAVFDDQSTYLKLKYLFDITDTHGQPHTMPRVWQLNETLEVELSEKLKVNTLAEWIAKRSYESIDAYDFDIKKGFEKELINTKLSGLPLEGVIHQFKQLLIDSTEYMTAIRCGIEEPVLSNINAFKNVTDFDDKALTLRLGYITSNLSEKILREIEKEIKVLKQVKGSVNNNESSGAGLSGSRRDLSPTNSVIEGEERRSEITWEIRSNGDELSQRRTNQSLQLPSDRGGTDVSHASSESGSLGKNGGPSSSDASKRSITRSIEHISELPSQRDDKDEVRGNHPKRNNIQNEIDEELPDGQCH